MSGERGIYKVEGDGNGARACTCHQQCVAEAGQGQRSDGGGLDRSEEMIAQLAAWEPRVQLESSDAAADTHALTSRQQLDRRMCAATATFAMGTCYPTRLHRGVADRVRQPVQI